MHTDGRYYIYYKGTKELAYFLGSLNREATEYYAVHIAAALPEEKKMELIVDGLLRE